MDLSEPPDDIELRNIIDKLAQFVARNGVEFEMMTKNKQKDNPKFQFLFGGEYFNYYQYKVTTEQAIFKQQQQQGITDHQMTPNNWNSVLSNTISQTPAEPAVDYSAEIEELSQEQDVLREQIKQSEQNLNAQHTVLLQQQQTAVDAAIAKCESEELQRRVEDCGLILAEMHSVLQPIIDTCTKDSISHGKSWFLQRADTKEKAQSIVQCFLLKTLRSATFPQKLHIIYLVNDLLHHSGRKHAQDFKDALETGVVPMFCNASIAATNDQRLKLDKLIKLWESKANYLKPETLEKLRKPVQSYQDFQTEQNNKYATQVAVLSEQTNKTFEGYQAQHQAFVCHAMQQIMDLQSRKENFEAQQKAQQQDIQPQPNLESIQATLQQTIQSLVQTNSSTMPTTAPPMVHQTFPIQQSLANQQPQNSSDSYMQLNPSLPPPLPPDIVPINSNGMDPQTQFTQPPPGYLPPPGMFPDFSKPPPGFPPKPEIFLEELVPSAPYYDLPAGLMVPLVRLEDSEYKALDPKDIRLPPPAPPSERLLAAVDAFYSLPTHERPRDVEGWEKLGLYEYYKAKNAAKREKEAAILAGLRIKSRSPSPIEIKQEKENTPPKRRYRSKSPTPAPETRSYGRNRRSRSRSRGRDRDRDRSRSRSRSPRRRRNRESRESRENRRRRSFSRSRSRSPPRRSRSRSISPPSFSSGGMGYNRGVEQELDSSNKGHQLLQKMGWGGKGLGAYEQGIDAPISGGDVRDRQDQFKGVGCNLNDPYENFRKNRGVAFITRMKARAEERDKDRPKSDF